MKKIFLILFLFSFLQVNAQEYGQNNMGFYIGFGGSSVTQPDLEGGPSFDGKGSFLFGLSYSRYLNQNLAIETGLSYLETEIERTPVGLNSPSLPLEMVNLRAELKYSFLKFLFINGGLLLDFEVENEVIDPQSGIGLGIGLGGEYIFSSGFNIFVNPYLNQHVLIPFNKEQNHQKLLNAGIRLGAGYRF